MSKGLIFRPWDPCQIAAAVGPISRLHSKCFLEVLPEKRMICSFYPKKVL
jgi:hypothetical protein